MERNVRLEVNGNELTICIVLDRTLGTSASGKSEIIATTGGNISIPGYKDIKVGLNVYRPTDR